MGDCPDLPALQHNIIMTAAAAPKAKAPAAHPPYAAMIKAAIKALGDKKGSSRQAILKYVCANYKGDAAKAAGRVRLALKKLVASKAIVAAAGKKGAGSFKLAEKPKAAKPVKAKKKPAAKKAKKPAKKAAKPKKAAAKPKKPAKAKKPAAKAKKP